MDKHVEGIHAWIQIAIKSENNHLRTVANFEKRMSELKEDLEKIEVDINVLNKTKEDLIVSIEMVEANLDDLGTEVIAKFNFLS